MLFIFQATAFQPDNVVRIIEDVTTLVRLQADHGDWSPVMRDAAGKTGRVVKVYADGDVRVKVIGNTWTFNPACLRAVHGSQTQMNNTNVQDGSDAGNYPALTPTNCDANQLSLDVAKIQLEQIVSDALNGNVDAIRKRLSSSSWKKSSRNLKAVRVALQAASRKGHVEVVRLLLDHCRDQIDLKSEGRTALHAAASCGQRKCFLYSFLIITFTFYCRNAFYHTAFVI
jgi:E3 ubiquitin-protein ligase mind-bomb